MAIIYKDSLDKQVFPIQQSLPNCGAYCTAYYLWSVDQQAIPELVNGKEAALVCEIYDKIKFGEEIPFLTESIKADFSNPVKIMQYLKDLAKPASFILHSCMESLQEPVLKNANTNESEINVIKADKYNFEGIQNEQFLFSLFNTDSGIHYVLIKREGGCFYFCNSWDGIIKGGTDTFAACVKAVEEVNPFKFLNSGILI